MARTPKLASQLVLSGIFAALWAPQAHAAGAVVERLEASVNASEVLLSDVREFRDTVGLRGRLDPLFSGTKLAQRGNGASDAEIVDFLVDERIISEQFPVTDPEVEQEINSIQASNGLDRDALKKALKEEGFTFDQYFALIRASISKRNLIDRDIRTKVHISDDDIKNQFYNSNSRGGSMTYRLHVIVVSPSNYKEPGFAKEAAEKALRDIRAGAEFEDVAKRVSDDPSATSGGDLGFLAEDEVAPVFRNKLKELKVGQVSDVFGSEKSGFFVVKLADLRSGQEDKLEKMKEQIRNQLTAQEYQRQITLWLERERQKAYVHLAGEPSIPPSKP